jgi:hypothetical protein
MNRFILMFLMIALAVSSLVACGIDADVHDAVVEEKEAAQASVAQLEKEKEAAQASVAQLEQENGRVKADLTEAEATIQDLMAVHPPRRFKDRNAIETWLRNDDISERAIALSAEAWLSKALEQQARALEDGYVVSAEHLFIGDSTYLVWMSAVAENLNYFSWDPEIDEVLFGANINQLPVE